MPVQIVFGPAARDRIVALREGGASWDVIAERMGCSRQRVIEEGRALGLATGPLAVVPSVERVWRARRDVWGKSPLPVWSDVSREVLLEAGLPVPRVGEVW